MFNFFRRIQNVLTADTKLNICFIPEREWDVPEYYGVDPLEAAKQLRNARIILRHLLPFINGIQKINTDDRMMPVVKLFPPQKFHQIKVIYLKLGRPVQSAIKPTMEWLASNNNNESKLLQLDAKNNIAKPVLEAIRKVVS